MIPILPSRDINYSKILISRGLLCNLRALQGSFCSRNGGTLCKRSVAEVILRIFSPLTPPFQKHVTLFKQDKYNSERLTMSRCLSTANNSSHNRLINYLLAQTSVR